MNLNGLKPKGFAFYSKVFFLIITAFTIRPSAFGTTMTQVGLATIFISFIFHIMDYKYREIRIKLSKQILIVLLTTFILSLYMAIQSTIFINYHSHLDSVFKFLLAHVIVLSLGAIILSDDQANLSFFKWLTIILISTVLSYLITLFITIFTPINSIYLFQIQYGDTAGYYDIAGKTYFPFTIMYGQLNYGHIALPRLLGLFRESGILQMFILWSLFNLRSTGLDKLWIKIVLVLGIVVTFSTAGVAFLFANIFVKMLLELKIFRASLLLAITYIVLIYTPYIGLNDKEDTGHGQSISDRHEAVINAWNSLQENPLGVGLYNTDVHNSGINLLAATHMIGIVGFVLCLLAYFIPVLAAESRMIYLLSVLPIALTSLTSQPIIDAPLVYLMLMAQYSSNKLKPLPSDVAISEVQPLRHSSSKIWWRNVLKPRSAS